MYIQRPRMLLLATISGLAMGVATVPLTVQWTPPIIHMAKAFAKPSGHAGSHGEGGAHSGGHHGHASASSSAAGSASVGGRGSAHGSAHASNAASAGRGRSVTHSNSAVSVGSSGHASARGVAFGRASALTAALGSVNHNTNVANVAAAPAVRDSIMAASTNSAASTSVNGPGSATASDHTFSVSTGALAIAGSFANGSAASTGGTASFNAYGTATAHNGVVSATANSDVAGSVSGTGSGRVAANAHDIAVAFDTAHGVIGFNISGGRITGSTIGNEVATGSYKAGGEAFANGAALSALARSGVFGELTGRGNGMAHSISGAFAGARRTSGGIRVVSLALGHAGASRHAFAAYHANASSSGDGSATTPIGAGSMAAASNSAAFGKVAGRGMASSYSFDGSATRTGTFHGATAVIGNSFSRGGLSTSGNGTAGFGSSGKAKTSLAGTGLVASIGVTSSARGMLPGTTSAPFDATGIGGANATGSTNIGSVATNANVDETAFGGAAAGNPAVTRAGANGHGNATVAITP